MRTATAYPYRRVFAVPALLAVISSIGLVTALIGDELFDVLSWLALAAPLAAITGAVIAGIRSSRRRAVSSRAGAARTGIT